MKSSLKFLTLSLFILLVQNSLATKYEAGNGSVAHSEKSVAIGLDNNAGDSTKPLVDFYSSAVGIKNKASGKNSSAFGYANTASGYSSFAFGTVNTASGEQTSAFGFRNKASKKKSSAFGHGNEASGEESSAFGISNNANGNYSSAFGYKNTASGEESSAFGHGNEASGTWSSAFGRVNDISGKESSAFGNQIFVSGEGSGAFGRGKWDNSEYKYKIEGDNSWAIGSYNSIATGSNNNHILGNSIAIGAGITGSIVLGDKSSVEDSNTLSIGSATNKRRIVHVAEGTADTDAVNVGQLNLRAKNDASNLSTTDVAAWKAKLGVGSGGGAVDAYTKAETDTKLATKANIADVYTKTDSDNKFLDKSTYNIDKATFATKTELNSRANKDGSNLSASDIAIWKTKLATGSVSAIANSATGTGSTGLGHGNIVAGNNSTAVGYKNNVSGNNSGAFGDPNTITGNRSYAVGNDNNIAGDDNFVIGSNVTIGAGITNSVALGNNSTVSESNEVSVGSKNNERKITNVADGELSETSTDAVNGRQLFKVANSISAGNTDALRKEFRRENEKVKNEVRQVGSLSAALSALHPLQYDKNKPNQIMAGFGQYRDKSAVAVGMAHYFTENLMMTGGVSLSEGSNTKAMANVGLTWKFGKGGSESTNAPNYVVQNEVSRLAKENAELKAKINAQDERMKALESKLEKLLKNK